MPSEPSAMKQNGECRVHGAPSKAANKTLLIMLFAAFSLIIWHVWTYGPTSPSAKSVPSVRPFPIVLAEEVRDLLFNRHGIIAELWDIMPYFVFGLLLAGLIRTYKIAVRLRRSLVKYGFLSIFLAALVGVITPLCACGVLTTAISLLFAGIPMAPVMALMVSSPLISPSAYLLTLSDLGPQWTVIRTVAAFLMGIFAGMVTHLLRNRGFQTQELFIEGAIPRGDFHDENYPREDLRCNCNKTFGARVAVRTGNNFLILLAKSAEMVWPVGKYVLIGVSFGAIIERYLPPEWMYSLFGRDDPMNIIWITLGAVPMFLHQMSASSILHHIKSGLDGTLSGGAGVAFLIGGPVTAIPTMMMLWALFKKRLFFLYLFICITGTIMLAYSFQYLVFVPGVDTDNPLLRGVRSVSGGASSVITKSGRNIVIVMNPGGKNSIAMFSDYLGEKGPAVFDGGPGRFLEGSYDEYDNRKYVGNIASWLEENSGISGTKNILVYNDVAGPLFSRKAVEDLQKSGGFRVTVTDRKDIPELTASVLEGYSQLWIISGTSEGGRTFSEAELQAVSKFSEAGSGILIVSGTQSDDSMAVNAANQLALRFGITFSGAAKNGPEIPVSTSFYFFQRAAGMLERMFRFMS